MTRIEAAKKLEDALNNAAAAAHAVQGETPAVGENEAGIWMMIAMDEVNALFDVYQTAFLMEAAGLSPDT